MNKAIHRWLAITWYVTQQVICTTIAPHIPDVGHDFDKLSNPWILPVASKI